MRTAAKKPNAKKMTDAERVALVNALCGKYAWVKGSSEDVLRERRGETEREEAEFVKRYLNGASNGTK